MLIYRYTHIHTDYIYIYIYIYWTHVSFRCRSAGSASCCELAHAEKRIAKSTYLGKVANNKNTMKKKLQVKTKKTQRNNNNNKQKRISGETGTENRSLISN